MKKSIRICLAAALALITLVSFTACKDTTEGGKSFERGTIESNVYHSDFAGLTFTKPDGWSFYTDEEIAAALGVEPEILESGEKFDASELSSTIDFQAVDPATGNNVNMTVEKLNALNAATITIDDYITSFRDSLTAQFQNISADFGDTTEVTIGANTYKRISADITMSGVSMSQVYFLRKVGKYIMCVTLTSMGAGDISAIEAMLS